MLQRISCFGMVFFLVTICLITSSFAETLEKKVEKHTFPIRSGGFITVIGDEGRVTVNSWDKSEVELIVTKRAWGNNKQEALDRLDELEVLIDKSDDELDIRLIDHHRQESMDFWDIFDPDRWGNRGAIVDFDLMVPREIDLRLETDEGDVEVSDVVGDIDIDVDEGDIILRDVKFGNIRLGIDEGDTDIRNIKGEDGRLTLKGDEGLFRLSNAVIDQLDVDTDEGEILIASCSIRNCKLSTDEGDIEAEFEVERDDFLRLSTDEGDIYVDLPDNTDIEVDIETEEGRIHSDFPIEIDEIEDGECSKDKIGRGGARLDIFSGEGDITLAKR